MGFAQQLETEIKKSVIGLDQIISLITVAVFARGHIMLEGDVGVGKTTLLRAVARAIGGAYERIEGTIDLMPNDLVYHTYINEQGKPQVDPGPILKHGGALSIFFFNEVNRARPQVHALLLRLMAEGSVSAFNREHQFPHLQVFADRNRVEKEETFEMPSAARDRFLMELHIETPTDPDMQRALMFEPRFHDVNQLLEAIQPDILNYQELNDIAALIQRSINASETLEKYALDLWQATRKPRDFGISLDGIDMDQLILAGASARGMSMTMRAARVVAWLKGRTMIVPEDIQDIFHVTTTHRIFFSPAYELRRSAIIDPFITAILNKIASP